MQHIAGAMIGLAVAAVPYTTDGDVSFQYKFGYCTTQVETFGYDLTSTGCTLPSSCLRQHTDGIRSATCQISTTICTITSQIRNESDLADTITAHGCVWPLCLLRWPYTSPSDTTPCGSTSLPESPQPQPRSSWLPGDASHTYGIRWHSIWSHSPSASTLVTI
ncbi:MAG: hypothetical protein JWP58_4668 [Hymenobacter sp.]|nr:hypothetical protein [Hymenobacter sp.]